MVDDVVARPAPRATPPAWLLYLAVLAGGMLGGTTRYLIGVALPNEPGAIPWAIVLVNVLGAFVISLLLAGWSRRGHVAHPWRPFLATGLLGSFTTWSTFIVDTYEMFVAGRDLLASVFVVATTAVGVLAAGAGWWTAQRVVPPVERTAAL